MKTQEPDDSTSDIGLRCLPLYQTLDIAAKPVYPQSGKKSGK